MIATLEEFFDSIDQHFLEHSRLKYCRAFANTGTHINGKHTGQQVEGWFKGELIYLLSTLQEDKRILSWKSEIKALQGSKSTIDFKVEINDHLPVLYFEVKALYLGWQTGKQVIYPAVYLTRTCYLGTDVVKLSQVLEEYTSTQKNVCCFCLSFVYPFPDNDELRMRDKWEKTRKRFCASMKSKLNIVVKETTQLEVAHYSAELYISRLEVQLGSQLSAAGDRLKDTLPKI